ncbi:MAG: DUF4998 domain-containing protein [Adhaeribacter sp.]
MKKFIYLPYCLLAALLCSIFSCSKMDDTYMDFVKDGEIIYAPKAQALQLAPGKNRVRLNLLGLSSRVSRVKVSWNNNAGFLDVNVPAQARRDTFQVIVPDLAEGDYTFSVVTYDQAGRQSVKADTSGTVFGNSYAATLQPRGIKQTLFAGDNLELELFGASSGTIGSLFYYFDKAGVARQQLVPADQPPVLANFGNSQHLKFKTLFLPQPGVIDTFYSALDSIYVEGPRVHLSKTNWTATASSYDTRSGASNRPPSKAIDDNISTLWVNFIGTPAIDYPHAITVDMKQSQPLRGLSFVQRQDLGGALKTLEIQVSPDNTTWTSLGDFTLEKIKEIQYIDFQPVGQVRYFRVIGKNDYNNSKNISLAEVGAYIR